MAPRRRKTAAAAKVAQQAEAESSAVTLADAMYIVIGRVRLRESERCALRLTNRELRALVDSYLKKVSYSGGSMTTFSRWQVLPQLRQLTYEHGAGATARDFRALVRLPLQSLRALTLLKPSPQTLAMLPGAGPLWPELRTLDITIITNESKVSVWEPSFAAFKHASWPLTTLAVSVVPLGDSLDLWTSSSPILAMLPGFMTLKTFKLSCGFTCDDARALTAASLPHLEYLSIEGDTYLGIYDFEAGDILAKGAWPRLQHLRLVGTPFQDVTLAGFASFTSLRTLHLDDCMDGGAAQCANLVAILSSSSCLEELSLLHTPFECFVTFLEAKLARLKRLKLVFGSADNEEEMVQLKGFFLNAQLPDLRTLELSFPSVDVGDGWQIDPDNDIQHVIRAHKQPFTKLASLVLNGLDFSQDSIDFLFGGGARPLLPSLLRLSLEDCRFSCSLLPRIQLPSLTSFSLVAFRTPEGSSANELVAGIFRPLFPKLKALELSFTWMLPRGVWDVPLLTPTTHAAEAEAPGTGAAPAEPAATSAPTAPTMPDLETIKFGRLMVADTCLVSLNSWIVARGRPTQFFVWNCSLGNFEAGREKWQEVVVRVVRTRNGEVPPPLPPGFVPVGHILRSTDA